MPIKKTKKTKLVKASSKPVYGLDILDDTKQQLKVILENLSEGVTAQNSQGIIIYCNEIAAEILGYQSTQELIGTTGEKVTIEHEICTEDGKNFPVNKFPGRVARRLKQPAEATMKIRKKGEYDSRWLWVKSSPILDRKGNVSMVVNVLRDFTSRKQIEEQSERSHTMNQFLIEAGDVLASSLDYHTTLKKVARLVVPKLADWCGIDILTDDEKIERLAVEHIDPKKIKLGLELNEKYPSDPNAPGSIQNVMKTGKPVFYPEIPDHLLVQSAKNASHLDLLRKIGFTALILVPLKVHNKIFGTITLVSSESKKPFTKEDLHFAEELARRASLAIENARLYELEKRGRENLEAIIEERTEEMRKANEILKKQIVERIHNLEALKESEQLLRLVLDTLPVAVWVTDEKGKVILENPAGQELWGQKSFIGVENFTHYKSWWADTGKRVEPEELAVFRALGKGETVLYEVMNIEALDGTRKTILNSAYPMRDEYDKITGAIIINEDITDRQKSAEELFNSRKELREYLDHMTTFNAKIAPDGSILLANTAAQVASGLPLNQLLKTNFIDIGWFAYDHEVHTRTKERFRLAASGTPVQYREKIRILGGTIITVELSLVPVYNDKKKVEYIVCEGHDVTAQQKAEDQLKKSESMLIEAQKIARIGSWEWDVFYNVVTWSDEMCEIYGVPTGYHGGYEDFLNMVHPEDKTKVRDAITYSLKKKKPFDFTHRIKRPDGKIRVLHARGNLALNRNNEIITFFGTGQDITEQQQAEDQLKNYTKKLEESKKHIEQEKAKDEAILSSLGDGIIATDIEGKIIMINPRGEQLLGHKKEELIGKSFFECMPLYDEDNIPVPIEQRPTFKALHKGEQTTVNGISTTWYYVKKNKTRFPISITSSPIMIKGSIAGAIQIFRDITREKEIDQSKNEFVSLASHQLRTPVSAINWYTETMLSGDLGKMTDKQKLYLEQLRMNSKRIITLINDLLNVSRIELGTFVVNPVPCNIHTLISSITTELEPLIKQKKLKLTITAKKINPHMTTDEKLVKVVLSNLLSNAVKYTPAKGKVTVVISDSMKGTKGACLDISVTDTGPGIAKDEQKKIFTKLFRSEYAQKQEIGGTGLGLYMSKSIVEYLGGTITYVTKPGKGTTFTVTLPVKPKMARRKGKKLI